nr:MAG TPA: hypothetical protein [Bacteriophage sp.]
MLHSTSLLIKRWSYRIITCSKITIFRGSITSPILVCHSFKS